MIQAGIISEGAVATAGGDRLEGGEEGELVGEIGIGGELLQEGSGFGGRAGGEGLADGQGQAARSALVLTAIAAIGEVGRPGLLPGSGGGGGGYRPRFRWPQGWPRQSMARPHGHRPSCIELPW